MAPARLLFVLTSPRRGGIEEVVLSLLNHLDRERFELALAAPDSLLRDLGGELQGLGLATWPVAATSWAHVSDVRALASCIRRFQPQVVNTHLFRSSLVGAPLAKWLGVPAVVETYHGREAWRSGVVNGCFMVDRLVATSVDRFIAVSHSAGEFLIRRKKVDASKVCVIPNGRDFSQYIPNQARYDVRRELGIAAGAPVIGLVGRLEPQKDPMLAVRAFADVRRRVPGAVLLVVGDGSLRAGLAEFARDQGLSGALVMTGFRRDIPRLMDAMDVIALPSRYEGMPLVAIEAAGMAKPVVASAVDGTPDVVIDGRTGRLVAPGDPRSLADALVATLSNPAQARDMGAAGRAYALTRFDLPTQVRRTSDLYASAMVRPQSASRLHPREVQ